MDIISLYPTVPAQPAIDIISEHIISRNSYCHKLTATDIYQLLSIRGDNTYFTYNGNTYKQTSGIPMGSKHIRHISYFIYGPTRTSATIYLHIMFILHKIYRRYSNGNLLSFLFRCDTRPYERGTQ